MTSEKLLYTVGYEGADLSDFIATLKAHNIRQLIDVRELPLSRKRGFSKNALASALAEVGVKYLHLKSLGDPKDGREAAKNGDIARFRRIYTRHLGSIEAKNGLEAAIIAAKKVTSSLLCYERDHADCHRSMVAEKLKDNFKIQHINVTSPVTKRRRSADGLSNSATLG
jgi:uncharacterized protein (DUF488 family)